MSTLQLKVPALGESITEAMIGRWKKNEGDAVLADEPLVEIESDKATVDVPSPGTGVLRRILGSQGDTVPVGTVIAEIELGAVVADRPAERVAPVPAAVPGPTPAGSNGHAAPLKNGSGLPAALGGTAPNVAPVPQTGLRASPSVRKLMHEMGVRSTDVSPSGPAGRIERSDLNRPPAAPSPPDTARPERIVPMTPLRKTVARRLLEAQQNAAILTTFNEINMAEVMALRERYQEAFQKRHGIKLGFMSFFVKAAVDALRAFPVVNAEVRGDKIVYKDYYDIGVAVGGGKGLVVPVVRRAESQSLAELERTIAELGGRARENKLALTDLAGGSFTISNGGVYGSLLSTPILNPPQSGILGLHAIQKRPIAVGEAIALRPMMYVALSYDHRIVDGREAVQFLVRIKECIENPERLLIEV